jgi:hypothetical protein
VASDRLARNSESQNAALGRMAVRFARGCDIGFRVNQRLGANFCFWPAPTVRE